MATNSQYQTVAAVMKAAGFGNLPNPPSDDDVGTVLRTWGVLASGLDPLTSGLCMTSAINALRLSGYATTAMCEKLVRAAVAVADSATTDDEASWVTYGVLPDGSSLVDIVRRAGQSKSLEWVVAYPPGSRVHPTSTTAAAVVSEVAGRHMWPAAALPWRGVPSAEAVEAAWADDDADRLSFDLINVFRHQPAQARHVVLAEPRGVWAVVLAMWVMGTYLLDRFRYYPMLLLEGPPARGKTRLGKAAAFLSYRGVDTATPTPATIFRNRSRHRISLFLDVKDLPGRMLRSDDIADLVLSSFERDKTVSRVLRPDADTPPDEQKTFVVYGPSILATNVSVRPDDPLVSRCLQIPLPEAGRQFVRDALRAEDALVLGLRARLVAWAARVIGTGTALPNLHLDALSGRMRDIGLPLLQITQLVRPECYAAVLKLLQGHQSDVRGDAAESWEGKLIAVLADLMRRGLAPGGDVGFNTVLDQLTKGPAPIPWKDPAKGLGNLCASLQIKTRKTGSGNHRPRVIAYPDADTMADLCVRYGVVVPEETAQTAQTDKSNATD